MIILGIDPGTSKDNPLGLCVLEWHGAPGRILHSQAVYDHEHPLPAIVSALDALPYPLDGIAVEAAWRGPNAQTLVRLAEVVGICISFAARRGVPLLRCQPAQAKQALTGDSKADKAAMIAAVWRLYSTALKKDCADAVGVAVWGATRFAAYAQEAA